MSKKVYKIQKNSAVLFSRFHETLHVDLPAMLRQQDLAQSSAESWLSLVLRDS